MSSYNLSRSDLIAIAAYGNIFKIMGERMCREVTVDYIPQRPAMVIPRLPGDGPLTASPPHVEELTFKLEDTLFGGEVFCSLVCRETVVVLPFRWVSWAELARSVIVYA